MPKKLISLRLSCDLLEKINAFQNNRNNELLIYRTAKPTFDRAGILCYSGPRAYIRGGPSIADVIEIALLEFFKDKKL